MTPSARTYVPSADYDAWVPENVPFAEITIKPAGGETLVLPPPPADPIGR
ncbi:hypothetical protein [Halostagnicola sp. A-GB9-2]|nr:hypothetical protein [Halostagnicola sp. A-GB9-2]MDJ1433804.1 hypothetical protein [Halostagnicola sp. A-GB9-2]